jgi:hypothetical protein
MAYTTINDPSEYFSILQHTGTSTDALSLVGAGFQPDWVWSKGVSNSGDNFVHDSNRGVQKNLNTNDDGEEATTSQGLQSFDSDGFTMGILGGMNFNNQTYVHWLWKCNGGTTASNSNGTITSTVQANTDAGFSIVTYTGVGATRTVGHGLGVAPKWIVFKNRNKGAGEGWVVYHGGNTDAPNTDGLHLNLQNATNDDTDYFSDQTVSSTIFGVSGDDRSGGSYNSFPPLFAEKQGYNKFGSYTGNGNADGSFVNTGFAPAWVMIKRTDSSSNGNWFIIDKARTRTNPRLGHLRANQTNAQNTSTNQSIDFLSNGFKLRDSNTSLNDGTYVYMAFAESPSVTSNGTPNNAR